MELTQFTNEHNIDIICIQETKLNTTNTTPQIPNYTANRQDRTNNKGGGLLTYIKHNHKFTRIQHNITNNTDIEMQITRIYTKHSHLDIHNIYIPPRSSCTHDTTHDTQSITSLLHQITNSNKNIILADANAHSKQWHSTHNDTRGTNIGNTIDNTDHIIINTNSHTRIPTAGNQHPSSPDITIIPNTLFNHTNWKTQTALSSDHLPIIITINLTHKQDYTPNKRSYTNYKKADWDSYTNHIEDKLQTIPTTATAHELNKILTRTIMEADKQYIPKGTIRKHQPIPAHIRLLIKQRDQTRKQNPTDDRIQALNTQITQAIQTSKQEKWIEQLAHTKGCTQKHWRTIHALSNKQKQTQPNIAIKFQQKTLTADKDIATAFNIQFTTTSKHTTNKQHRIIKRTVHKLHTDNIHITTEETIQAIKNTRTTNSCGPDNINIRHLQHLGPNAITFLTHTYNIAINTNNIPQSWKTAHIIPIPKPNKDTSDSTAYRPISLTSAISKTLEKIILPHITNNIPNIHTQHGFKKQHSTTTALHNINTTITNGFNQSKPPQRTIITALDMSKAFDTVNLDNLTNKLLHTNIPHTIIKFLTNYINGRQAFTTYNNKQSPHKIIHTGVPQGGVLSPTLFNIYMADITTPSNANTNIITYADDITITSTHTDIDTASKTIQPTLNDIQQWTKQNSLHLNANKTNTSIHTPAPSEHKTQTNLSLNNHTLNTNNSNKILGLTFDTQHTFTQHINKACTQAEQTLNILKALTSTHWGKQKETIINTYKAITLPILEYANTIWSPIISDTNINKLQTIQNKALRIATGCTTDTNIQHLHEESQILPIKEHLILHASQLRQQAQHPQHPLHHLTQQTPPNRYKKPTIFNNNHYTINIDTAPDNTDNQTIKTNMKQIHTHIVQTYLNNRTPNKIINIQAPKVNTTELQLNRFTRRTLAQLRTNKSPLLQHYKHKINPTTHTSPLCPLCMQHIHNTAHIFSCTHIPTNLTPLDLWHDPIASARLLAVWGSKLGWPEDLGGPDRS
jgi:hypothetical protein